MVRRMLFLFVLVSSILFAEADAPMLTPIDVTGKNTGTVSVTKIETTLDASSTIGRNRKTEKNITWLPGIDPIFSKRKKESAYSANEISNENIVSQYVRIMNDEMKKAGYSVESSNTLFEDNSKQNTDFYVGAIIKKCNVRNVTKPIKKDYVQVHFEEIEWQIYDTKKKEVVLKTTTNGYSQRKGTSVYEPAVQAFERAFRNFLAQDAVVRAVSTPLPPASQPDPK